MPKFLTQQECYRLLQRELPEDVYPDVAPSGSFATADSFSNAKVLSSAYANQSRIYANYFPQTADEKIADWEVTAFNAISDSTLSLSQRRARVLKKLRSHRGIKASDMLDVVLETLPALFDPASATPGEPTAEIAAWHKPEGGWILDESQLGVETFLSEFNGQEAYGPDLATQDWHDWSMSEDEWLALKEQAYTYEVRIYNYTLTAQERAVLDLALSAAEPARSGHVITDSLTDADKIEGDT